MEDKNKSIWSYFDLKIHDMSRYLSEGNVPDNSDANDILDLMLMCLSLVSNEICGDTGRYQKYQPKIYSDEDFVDMVIDSIAHEVPADKEGMKKYIEDFRSVLWGHANYHHEDYLKLQMDFENSYNKDTTFSLLRQCMVIVNTESMLRRMEKW